MKFEDMSEESQEVAKEMILYCIEHGLCMGMDEGFSDFGGETRHPFRKELEYFSGYKI